MALANLDNTLYLLIVILGMLGAIIYALRLTNKKIDKIMLHLGIQ